MKAVFVMWAYQFIYSIKNFKPVETVLKAVNVTVILGFTFTLKIMGEIKQLQTVQTVFHMSKN